MLVTHVVPYPPSAGNEIRILKLIAWLRGQGFAVVLLLKKWRLPGEVIAALESRVDRLVLLPAPAQSQGGTRSRADRNPLVAALAWRLEHLRAHAMAIPLVAQFAGHRKRRPPYDESDAELRRRQFCPPELVEVARHLCAEYQPSVVIAEYIFLSGCLDAAPAGALRIIDTIDMFSLKRAGVLAHGIDDPLALTPGEEREHLLKADVVIAIQPREAELMGRLVPERQVINVGVDFEVNARVNLDAVVSGRVLVVGSDNPLNLHGLRSFLDRAWPAVRERCPWATLRVVGKVGRAVDAPMERVELVGWVSSLDAEYAAADVVINPTVAGTGLKIKTVEALCHGGALVAWPNGVDGLVQVRPSPFRVANDWSAFADAVVELLQSPLERARLQQTALNYAKASFDREKVYAPLRHALAAHFASANPVAAAAGQVQ